MKVCLFILKIYSGSEILNEILTSKEGLTLYQMYNNRDLDLVNINAITNFVKIISIWVATYDGNRDRGTEGQNDGRLKSSI